MPAEVPPPTFADLQAAQGTDGRVDPKSLAMPVGDEDRAAFGGPTEARCCDDDLSMECERQSCQGCDGRCAGRGLRPCAHFCHTGPAPPAGVPVPTEAPEAEIIEILDSYFRYTLRLELDEDIPACAKDIAEKLIEAHSAGVAAGRSQARSDLAEIFKSIAERIRHDLAQAPPMYQVTKDQDRIRAAAWEHAARLAEGSDG